MADMTKPEEMTGNESIIPYNEERVDDIKEKGPNSLSQTLICMLLMLFNNVYWVLRKKFSPSLHITNFALATIILIITMPCRSGWPAMLDERFVFQMASLFVF